MASTDPYQSLGVRPRINAAGALTRLGGAVMAPEVVAAMAAAARASVDIGELQDAASGRIAQATGAEAGLVTTGAAAALTLAAAAAIARWDVAKMAALPHADSFPHDILIPRTHRTGYAHALAAAGAGWKPGRSRRRYRLRSWPWPSRPTRQASSTCRPSRPCAAPTACR